MIRDLNFIKGELRKITYHVKSKKNENFTIESCDVEIFNENVSIMKLHSDINGNEITFIIDTSLLESNYYAAIITFKINEEIIKKKMNFTVRENG